MDLKKKLTESWARYKPMARMGHYCRLLYFTKTVRHISFKSALDAGCGSGYNSFSLIRRHSDATVWACDEFLPEYFLTHPSIRYLNCRLENLPFKKEFDLIFCIDVLEHIDDDERIISNFYKYLANDGHLYLHVPFHKQTRHWKTCNHFSVSDHKRTGYSEEGIRKILTDAGFQVIYMKRTFGWFGSIAWELGQMVESLPSILRTIGKATLNQVLKIFIHIDYCLRNRNGNGIAVLAKKRPAHQDKHRKTSVLLLTYDYPPFPGGVANYSLGIKGVLSSIAELVCVLTTLPDIPVTGKKDFLVRRVCRRSKWGYVQLLRAAIHAVTHHRIQKIVAMSWSPAGWIACFIKLTMGVPYVVISFGSDVMKSSGGGYTRTIFLIKKQVRKLVFRYARPVAAVSDYTRTLLLEYYPYKDSIHILHPGIYPDMYQSTKTGNIQTKYPELRGKRILLTVARLVPNKGIDRIMHILADLVQEFPNIFFAIIGNGPDRNRLEILREHLHLNDWSQLYTAVERDELIEFYQLSEIVLLLSFPDPLNRCTEGFGMVLLEAAACKKPVIASRAGGIPDAVLDGVTGILVDPDSPGEIVNAIKKVFSDKKLAESLGQAGYNRCIREFTWDSLADSIDKILEQ